MKNYRLSTGQLLSEKNINRRGDLELKVQWNDEWTDWPVSVIFTRDDDSYESADNSVALFERIYAKREYWLMLAYHQLKVNIIDDDICDEYENYINRDAAMEPPFYTMKYSIFDELLMGIEMTHAFFGTEGEIVFLFYDFSRDCSFRVSGTETERLTTVEKRG